MRIIDVLFDFFGMTVIIIIIATAVSIVYAPRKKPPTDEADSTDES